VSAKPLGQHVTFVAYRVRPLPWTSAVRRQPGASASCPRRRA